MFAGEHAVGGVIIAAENKIDALRANFEIEDFVNLDLIERRENHKVLYCFVAPGFHSLGKFMLSEAMRLSGAICLYQPVVGRDYPKKEFRKILINYFEPTHSFFEKLTKSRQQPVRCEQYQKEKRSTLMLSDWKKMPHALMPFLIVILDF